MPRQRVAIAPFVPRPALRRDVGLAVRAGVLVFGLASCAEPVSGVRNPPAVVESDTTAPDRTTRKQRRELRTRAKRTRRARAKARKANSATPLLARRGCGTQVAWIGATGDLVMHGELQRQALADGAGWTSVWDPVAELLDASDLTVLNVEGAMAPGIDWRGREMPRLEPRGYDRRIYTGYPHFNMHPSLAEHLSRAGVDLVSTANNHAWDRGALGVGLTLESYAAAGIQTVGTRPERKRKNTPWSVVTEVGPFRVGWVACTKVINGIGHADGRVMRCGETGRWVRNDVRRLRARDDVDAIGVLPHWGNEYDPTPGPEARAQARLWVDAGADFVLGSHPHVLQPWEHLQTPDGRDALVVYSMGNFASHQRELERRSGAWVWLALREARGRAAIAGFGYVPLEVREVGEGEAFHVEGHGGGGLEPSPASIRHVTASWQEPFALRIESQTLALTECDGRWWERSTLGWQGARAE